MNIMLPVRTLQLVAQIAPNLAGVRAVQLAHAQFHLEPARQYLSRVRFRQCWSVEISYRFLETRLPNERYDGCCAVYGPNGRLIHRQFYVNGTLNGVRMEWYNNGYAKKMETYIDGKLHGLVVDWWATGRIHERCNYVDGDLHGEYICYDHNGLMLEHCTYVRGLASHYPE